MAVKIGDVDLANEIIELHFQLRKTQHILESVINKMLETKQITLLQPEDITKAEDQAFKFVREKFPNMDIRKK